MTLPRRIILSRKGFDGSCWKRPDGKVTGGPSPIYADGTMFSIPIPENAGPGHHTHFDDLGTQSGLKLPEALITPRRQRIDLTGRQVHLDPDIRPTLRPGSADKRSENIFLFGQDDSSWSQTILDRAGVTEGDLFLFFGLFKLAVRRGACDHFVPGAKLKHVIWGWLQVTEKHPIEREGPLPEALRFAGHHPHIVHRSCYTNNCIYVGSPSLSFREDTVGAGIFNRYSDDLRLTQEGEHRHSFWALPRFFADAGLTYHGAGSKFDLALWEPKNVSICGQSAGRGQEFVMNTNGVDKQAEAWLVSIFKHAKKAI